MSDGITFRISDDDLADSWFKLKHRAFEALTIAFRGSKLNQADVADRIGKDPAYVSRCLKGQQNLTLRTMSDLARGMNCRLRIELDSLDHIQPKSNRPGKGARNTRAVEQVPPGQVRAETWAQQANATTVRTL